MPRVDDERSLIEGPWLMIAIYNPHARPLSTNDFRGAPAETTRSEADKLDLEDQERVRRDDAPGAP